MDKLGYLLGAVCIGTIPTPKQTEVSDEALKHSLHLEKLASWRLSRRDRGERTRVSQGQLRGEDWGDIGADFWEVPDPGIRTLVSLGPAVGVRGEP
jgi:hypothetical protein